jgi:hypothetical protein
VGPATGIGYYSLSDNSGVAGDGSSSVGHIGDSGWLNEMYCPKWHQEFAVF